MLLRRIWRVVVASVVLIILAGQGWGEVPPEINYQGRLLDSAGTPLAGEHDLAFRICDALAGGAVLWTETQAVEVDSTGVFAVILGAVNPIGIAFDGPRWLEVAVDGETLTPRREMVSVPFAFHAAASDSLGGMHSSSFSLVGHVHDDRYYTETELSTTGTINDDGNPVDWTKIKSVPAGLADGTDDVGGAGDGYSLDGANGGPVDAVYVNVYGKVGIGTTSPGTRVHVREDANAQIGIALENHDPGASSAERISFNDENGSVAGIITHDNDYTGFPNGMQIFNNRAGGGIGFGMGGGLDLVRLIGGKVGIGNLNPQARLHVCLDPMPSVSVPASTEMLIEGQTSPVLNFMSSNTGTQSILFGDSDDSDVGGLTYSHSDNLLSLRTGGAERMRIAGDGRVGIGTVPQLATKLFVDQNSSENGATSIYGRSSSSTAQGAFGVIGTVATTNIGYENAGVYGSATAASGAGRGVVGKAYGATGMGLYGYADHASGENFALRARTNSPNGFAGYFDGGRNYFGGNVGIGTVAPLRKLHIYEDVNGALSYPIKVENYGSSNGTATGILFKVDGGTEDRGKGAIVYERTDTWNRGSIRFLQRRDTGTTEPARISDAVMTIANNGMVYIGLGWAGEPRYRLQVVDTNDSSTAAIHNGRWERGTALSLTSNASVGELLAAGSGLASAGSNFGIFAHTTSLGDNDQAGVYAKLARGNQSASLCYRSAAGTQYKVYGDGIASSIMQTSKGRVNLVCPESPEAWIDDYGSAEIKAGICHVDLDPTYLECITVNDANPLKVFVQLTSPIEQQYYVKKGATGFDVMVIGSGASEASGTFDYRVVGKWKGYETFRFERAMEPPTTIEVSNADSPK